MKKSVVYMCLYFRIILFKIRVLPKSSSEAFPTLELLPKKLLILAFLPSSSPGISQTLFLLMFLRLFLCDGIFVYFDFCKQLLESRLFFCYGCGLLRTFDDNIIQYRCVSCVAPLFVGPASIEIIVCSS